jgi:F-type H+-transporting ATPase subunit b
MIGPKKAVPEKATRVRGVVLAALAALVALPAFAQEGGGQIEAPQTWLVANFVILVAGLSWMIAKNGGPFLAARLKKIRQDIVQGEEARREAQRRAAEVDERLANLDKEIAALRLESQKELENELERMRRKIAADRERIRVHSEQEIAAAGKTARAELKRYVAELAIGLAERKIRGRMNAATQDSLIGGFAENLDRSGPEGRAAQA